MVLISPLYGPNPPLSRVAQRRGSETDLWSNTGPGARFEAVAMSLHHCLRFAALAVALGAGALASAQTPPAAGMPAPGAVESAPLPPPGGTAQPAPPAPSPPQTATPAPLPGGPTGGARPTLVPEPGDAGDVAEVTLPGKPAAVISGTKIGRAHV